MRIWGQGQICFLLSVADLETESGAAVDRIRGGEGCVPRADKGGSQGGDGVGFRFLVLNVTSGFC